MVAPQIPAPQFARLQLGFETIFAHVTQAVERTLHLLFVYMTCLKNVKVRWAACAGQSHRPPGGTRINNGVQGGEDLQVVATTSLWFESTVYPMDKCGGNVLVKLILGEAGIDLS